MRLRNMCIYNVYIYGILLSTCVVAGRPVKIGILCSNNPNSWEYLFGIASAINIAQDKLIEQEIIQNDSISSIVWRDTRTQADGLGQLVDLVNNENVDVIFGSPKSKVSHSLGHLTSYWNIPQVIWRGNSLELSNKTLYTTLVRTIGPLSESGLAIVSLFKKYKWEKIGLLYTDRELCEIGAIGVKASFGEHNLTVMQSVTFPFNTTLTDDTIVTYLSLFKQSSRTQKIHLSEAMYCALNKIGGYAVTFRAEMEIKGKGLMQTYWLESKDCSSSCIMSTGHLQTL